MNRLPINKFKSNTCTVYEQVTQIQTNTWTVYEQVTQIQPSDCL